MNVARYTSGRPLQDRIKEHDRDIRLARIETSAVSEHAHNTGHKSLWNEVKFIYRDPYYYTCRVNEAIHIRLHFNNINRDSGIEIRGCPRSKTTTTGEPCNNGPPREQITDQQGSKCTNRAVEKQLITAEHHAL